MNEIRSSDDAWTARCPGVLGAKLMSPEMHRFVSDDQWAAIERMPGWCRREKAEALVRLVKWGSVHRVVEIGVWGGRSLQAFALGLSGVTNATLVGIDPYDPEFCGTTTAETLATLCEHMRLHWPGATLLRCHSTAIIQLGYDVDVVHIDGNHASPAPLVDVETWYPRVRRLGYVVMDDAHYPGVREATAWLEAHGAELLVDVTYPDLDPNTNDVGGWKLYQKVRP